MVWKPSMKVIGKGNPFAPDSDQFRWIKLKGRSTSKFGTGYKIKKFKKGKPSRGKDMTTRKPWDFLRIKW